jgi:transcription initiation factor TFIIB
MASIFSAFEENANGEKNGQFKEDLNRIHMCTDCKEEPPNLVEEYSSGDMVCASCGLVLDRIIDTRSEWRTFSGDDNGNDDPSRVGDAPNLMIDGDQLQTAIAFDGKGARNLAHLQNKVNQDKGTKVLLQAYRDIQALTDSINAGTQVANTAKHIFKMVEDNKALKGKSQEAIVAGCIFIACRQTNVPRTFREVYGLTKVSKKEIGRVFKQLESFLQKMGGEDKVAKATGYSQQYQAKGSTTADELCVRYCSNLSFRNPVRVESVARRLAEKSSEVSDLAGRSPLSVAAACIYMASHLVGEPRNTKQISVVSSVSDGTVKTAYRYLYAAKDAVLTKEAFPEEMFAEVLANTDKVPAN